MEVKILSINKKVYVWSHRKECICWFSEMNFGLGTYPVTQYVKYFMSHFQREWYFADISCQRKMDFAG